MNKRIAQAIADLELLRPALKGPHLLRLEMVIQNLMTESAAAARMRKMRAKDKDCPSDGTHGKRNSDANTGVTVTPDVTLLPSAGDREGDKIPSLRLGQQGFATAAYTKEFLSECRELEEPQSGILSVPSSSSPLSSGSQPGKLPMRARARRANRASHVASHVTSEVTRTPASQVTQTWSTYCDAYRDRYGIEPVRNAKVNSQLKQFAQRVPAEDWAATIQHYLRSRNARYVAAGHSVGALLADAEKLRTEALTGKNGTAAGARRDDALADKGNQLEELLEWNRAREAARAEGRLGDGE